MMIDERLDFLMEKKHRLVEDFPRPRNTEDEIGADLCTELEPQGEATVEIGDRSK